MSSLHSIPSLIKAQRFQLITEKKIGCSEPGFEPDGRGINAAKQSTVGAGDGMVAGFVLRL